MSGNPFLKRIEQRGKNGHGKKSEQRLAKSLGARLQPNSGAMKGAKGDMHLKARKHFKLEAKSTIHASMSLDLGWLVKVTVEALNEAKVPGLTVSFVGPDGKPRLYGDWVMIPKADFQELVEE